MLSHSYEKDDVTFMLESSDIKLMSVQEKEEAIQSGVHYGRISSKESKPSQRYIDLFDSKVEQFSAHIAHQCIELAGIILASRKNPVLISLVRAGTPVGVVLKRILNKVGFDAPHFSVSIVRDRGLDLVAIDKIIEMGHDPSNFVFVDGWTGKGVIRNELSKSISKLKSKSIVTPDEMFVLSDIAGVSDYAATREDTLIPSALLNASVSGLVSRSFMIDDTGQLQHCANYLEEFKDVDRSLYFIDAIMAHIGNIDENILKANGLQSLRHQDTCRAQAQKSSRDMIHRLQERLGISDANMIKPGIGESSRVLLRRMPDRIILKSLNDPSTEHLVDLANSRNVPIEQDASMSIKAVAIIKDIGND